MRIEVDEDIKAVRAATMSKAASPFVVGSAMAAGRSRSVWEERRGEASVGVQALSNSCIGGERCPDALPRALWTRVETQLVAIFGGFEGA